MKRIVSAICILYVCVGLGLSQSPQIDNHNWQVATQDKVQFRVPDTWENTGDAWVQPDGLGTIRLVTDFTISEFTANKTIESEENSELPIGQVTKFEITDTNSRIQVYDIQSLAEPTLLIASISVEITEAEQRTFFAIVNQIANTLQTNQENEEAWSLYANADATIFLRTPLSWSKQTSDADTVSVTQIFDDVLVSITYRDLGRPFELAEVEEQFQTIYTSNSYDIQAQEIVNLPIGDALYFQLGDVRVTSTSTHIQLHYAIARENYLIVVTAGADEAYFTDYESILRQIIDTIVFDIP